MTPRRQYPQRRFLHVDAVAEILGVAPNTVGIWIRHGVIPSSVVYQLRKGAPYMLEEGPFWEWIDSTRIDRTDLVKSPNEITATGEELTADSA